MDTQPPTQPLTPPIDKKKVLIVEDDNSLASVYTTRFMIEGFLVRRVANGEDALSAALEFRPNIIMLDVMMPKINGFDVLDILKNTPELSQTKVMMLTALSSEDDQEKAKIADDYMVKSQVTMDDVVERVKYHLAS